MYLTITIDFVQLSYTTLELVGGALVTGALRMA